MKSPRLILSDCSATGRWSSTPAFGAAGTRPFLFFLQQISSRAHIEMRTVRAAGLIPAGQLMDPRNERDEWLMAQVALGKRDHLEPLVRRHASPLLTFIRRMVGDAHRSEELFQEVFLAVWDKRKQYAFPRPFKSWLYAIALNKCRAWFRSPSPAAVSVEDVEPAAPDPSPADTAIATETAALVSTAIERL